MIKTLLFIDFISLQR